MGSSPFSDFAAMVSQVPQHREAEGRGPSSFQVGERVYVAFDRPPQEVCEWFGAVYGRAVAPEVAVRGSPQQLVEELLELRGLGQTSFS